MTDFGELKCRQPDCLVCLGKVVKVIGRHFGIWDIEKIRLEGTLLHSSSPLTLHDMWLVILLCLTVQYIPDCMPWVLGPSCTIAETE